MGALLSSLRDNFTDNSVSVSAWVATASGSATVAETGGQARFTLPSSTAGTHIARYTSRYQYDLTSDNFFINIETMVATGVAATAFFQLYLDGVNALQWIQVSGTLTGRTLINGVSTNVYSVAWNASTYKYLRIRADTTTVYWDSSTDGVSWTNRATATIASLGFPITDLFVDFGATCGNIASPGSFRLDDVNQILPALTTNWRWAQARRALANRVRRSTIAVDTAGTVQGYLITADGVDTSQNPSGNVRYWSGPAGGGRLLTEYATEAEAQAQAVNLPVNGALDFAEQIECRVVRLGMRSIDGNSFVLYEFYPRRLVQSDDIEAESIRAINLAASAVTVDKLDATLTITGKNIQTAYNGARVVMSGDAFGGLVTYDDTDTYSTTAGTGTYQILLSLADGKLYAGDGVVVLDDDGISITGSAAIDDQHSYKFYKSDGTTISGRLSSYQSAAPSHNITLSAESVTGDDASLSLNSFAPSGGPTSQVFIRAQAGIPSSLITLTSDGTTSSATISSDTTIQDDLTVEGGLNVGTATGATTGQVFASSSLNAIVEDAVTASRTVLMDLSHNSSGTPATNFGSTIRWFLESSTTASQVAARQIVDWEVATHASRSARMIFQMTDSAADRECMRMVATGAAAAIGFLGAAAVVRQTVGAAAPAGGTGATAGAYDTAANRNAMITLLNNIRTAGINLGLWQT